jgi:stage IV sporulation protein A
LNLVDGTNLERNLYLTTQLMEIGIPVVVADCQIIDTAQIMDLLLQLLYAFPMKELHIYLPRWIDALEQEHPVKAALYKSLLEQSGKIRNLGQATAILDELKQLDGIQSFSVDSIDLGRGIVSCTITFPESLFYQILSTKAGIPIENDGALLSLLTELTQIKKEYSRIAEALSAVKSTGYGIVMPSAEEMTMQKPEIVRKGGAFGVKLKAGAPSIRMIRVDIDTEISPMVGGEQQSQDLITYLTGEDPDKLWESNLFGRSVYTLIQEGLTAKLVRTPEDVRTKFRGTLTRIVNEGATGLICLIL